MEYWYTVYKCYTNCIVPGYKINAVWSVKFKKGILNGTIFTQVLQRLSVLRWCFLSPYVPLPALAARAACEK